MPFTLGELAALVEGEVRGNPERTVAAVRSLPAAGPDDLSFLTQARYRDEAVKSAAGALLVGSDDPELPHDLLICANPALAVAELLRHFHPPASPPPGVHATAVVGAACTIDPQASIGPYVVIGDDCRIEAGAVLHAGVVLGRSCRVGAGSVLHPRVVLYDDTELGARVIVHSGAVLGADGFGYAVGAGRIVKVPQVGRVVVEDDVEIGANTTIDRAALEETRIGAGSKLDNLVQVGHNVRLGRGCMLSGQVGLAGSATLGDGVVMGGRAGSAGHLEIGAGAQVAATGVVFQSVPPGAKVGGTPAIPLAQWRREVMLLPRLGELFRRVRRLERAVAAGEAGADEEDGT